MISLIFLLLALGCFFIGTGLVEEAGMNHRHWIDRTMRFLAGIQVIAFGVLLLWGLTHVP